MSIQFSTKDETYTFFIEFFAKGNMLLCDANQTILSPLQPQSWSDRTLRGGIPYEHPVRDTHIFSLTLEKLKQLPFQDTISKTLAIELGIGGLYAEELCYRANLDLLATQLSDVEWKHLYQAITTLLATPPAGCLVMQGATILDITPYPLHRYNGKEQKKDGSFSEAIASYYSVHLEQAAQKQKTSGQEKKLAKINSILEAQTKQVEKMEIQAKQSQRTGELIYENYQLVKDILTQIQEARKKYTWQEIKQKLKDHDIIKEVNEKTGELILELQDQ